MPTTFQTDSFRKLWIAQVVLTLGDALMQMGLLEYFRVHGYQVRVETAKLLFAVSLPGAALGPVVIAWLDRWQRRRVLMTSDALRAGLAALILACLWPVGTGQPEAHGLLAVFALMFLIGVITAFHQPARYALVPNLVETENLVRANTVLATSLAVAGVGGRAVGGFVAERFGVEWAVLANVLAYLSSILLVWRIRSRPHAVSGGSAGPGPGGGWRDLKAGLGYLGRHPTALPLVLLSALFAFLAAIFLIAIVGYANETLGLRTGGLGYLVAGAGVGAAAGMAVTGRGRPWTRAAWLPFVQLILVGLLLVLLSRTVNVWLAAALLVPLGAVGATVLIPIDARLQAQVDDPRRGAVFAARGMLTSLVTLVAYWLQFGTILFRRTAAPTILLWLGLGAFLSSFLALMAGRKEKRTL